MANPYVIQRAVDSTIVPLNSLYPRYFPQNSDYVLFYHKYPCIPVSSTTSFDPRSIKTEFFKFFDPRNGFYYVPPSTYPGDPYGGLERYWREGFMWLFMEFFQQYNTWTFKPVDKPPSNDNLGLKWRHVIHSAKVRFNCQKAGHGWTSMQGRVVFWYRLRRTETETVGEALFKLYGQKCEKCQTDTFETPLWYPEEIASALWHLYYKVGEKYYGKSVVNPTKSLRQGKPQKPHKPELCQACKDGVCRYRKQNS